MEAPALLHLGPLNGNEPAVMDRRDYSRLRQQLLDSSCIFMLFGVLILLQELTTTGSTASGHVEHAFAAFVLWLLGAALGMLSVVVQQLPGLAAAGAAVAGPLREHLLGL